MNCREEDLVVHKFPRERVLFENFNNVTNPLHEVITRTSEQILTTKSKTEKKKNGKLLCRVTSS